MLTILCTATFFAACGDEETGDSSESDRSAGGALLCIAYLLVSGNSECVSWMTSGGSSSSGGSNISTVGFAVWDEAEPNDDWLSAMPISFPKTADKDGFIVKGSVNDVADRADVFSITRTFTRFYNIRLCADGNYNCNEYGEIDTLTAHIDILDGSGKVIASTQADTRNQLRVKMAGGYPFYIRVAAGDTMGATVAYELIVHEDD